jgi:hypothetical protein
MACASPRESRIASPSAPTIVDIYTPAISTDAGLTAPVCKTVFMRGSFCDELGELWRVVQSDSAMRRCIAGHTEDATSALPGIGMYCQARSSFWGPDCAGNPPAQSDVVVSCLLALGHGYGDKKYDLASYVRRAAAAVAACDPAYRASPIRDLGARDMAIGFSLPREPGSRLEKVVSVCSEPGYLMPDETLAQPELQIDLAHYNVVIQLYGVAPDAGAPAPR